MGNLEFDSFAAAELDGLLRFATVLTGDRELARDLVQEVMYKVYRRWSLVAAADYPRAYARTMLTPTFLSWRRRWSTRNVILLDGELPEGPTEPDHAAAIVEQDAVWRRLALLPHRQRSVLVLRYYERLSDAEIAEILGCLSVTVRGYATRALATLRLDLPAPQNTVTEQS